MEAKRVQGMPPPSFVTPIGTSLWEVHAPRYPDGMLTTMQAARVLHLSKATLETLRSRGGGPAYFRLRGRVFYDLAGAIQWLEANLEARR